MRYVRGAENRFAILFALLSVIALPSCHAELLGASTQVTGAPPPRISSVALSGDKLTIGGSGLSGVSGVSVSGPGVSATLQILTKSDTSLAVKASSQVKLALGSIYNLMITSASADSSSSVTFQVTDGSIGPAQLDRSYVVSTGGSMTGALILPLNGLTVGTSQLVLSGGNVGIGTTSPAATLDVNGTINASQAYTTLTDGATIAWTVAGLINNAKVTLGGNRTLSFSGLSNGMTGTLLVAQDATGARTLALPSQCADKVVGGGNGVVTLTSTANAIDILTFTYDGTNCYWTYGNNYK